MCVRMRQRADPHPQCQDTRMFSLNSGRLLMSLSALVLLCSVILVLLTDSSSAQPLEAASSHTVTALAGEDVVLPCHLEPAADVVSQSLEWGRLDLNPRFIHVWHEGQDLLLNQNPSYRGRTSLSTEKLKHGDLSLTLSALTHSDNGRYRCYFPSTAKTAEVELLVGSVSSPVIAAVTVTSDVVVLECRSGGWFPEPELLWLDAEGKLLSAGPTETVRGSDDLYTVSSRVTVDKRHSSRYTCRVQQTSINHTSEAHIEVTDDFFPKTRSFAPTIVVVVVVVVIVVVLVLVAVGWKWRHNKSNKKPNRDEEAQRSQETKHTSIGSEQACLLENERSNSENYTTNGQEANVQTSYDPNNGHNRGMNEADENAQDDVTSGEGTVKRRETPDTEHEEDTNTTSGPVEASADDNKSSVNNRDTHGSGDAGTNQNPINQSDSLKNQHEYEKNKPGNQPPAEDESKPTNNKDNTNSVSATTESSCKDEGETEDQPGKKENSGDGKEQRDQTSHPKGENGQNLKVDEEENGHNTSEKENNQTADVDQADNNRRTEDVEPDGENSKQTVDVSATAEHGEEKNDGKDTTSGSGGAGTDQNQTNQGDSLESQDKNEKNELEMKKENEKNGHEEDKKQKTSVDNKPAAKNEADGHKQQDDVTSGKGTMKETQTPDTEHEEDTNTTSGPVEASADDNKSSVNNRDTHGSGDAGTNQNPINQSDSLKNQHEYEKNKPGNQTPAEDESKPPINKDNTNSVSATTESSCKDEGETEDQTGKKENRGDGKEQRDQTSHPKGENGQNLKVDEEENGHNTSEKENNQTADVDQADNNRRTEDVEPDGENSKQTVDVSTTDAEHGDETNDGEDTTSGSGGAGTDQNQTNQGDSLESQDKNEKNELEMKKENEKNDHEEDKKQKTSVDNKPAAKNEADGHKQQDDVTSGEETLKETLSADTEHEKGTNTTSGPVEASADDNKSSVNNTDTHGSGGERTESTCGEKEETQEDHSEKKDSRDGEKESENTQKQEVGGNATNSLNGTEKEKEQEHPINNQTADVNQADNNRRTEDVEPDGENSKQTVDVSTTDAKHGDETNDGEDTTSGSGGAGTDQNQTNQGDSLESQDKNEKNELEMKKENERNGHEEDKKQKTSVDNKPAAKNEAGGDKQQDDVTSGEETVIRRETPDTEHEEDTNTTSGLVEASADDNKCSVNNTDTHGSGGEGTESTCGEKEETQEDNSEKKDSRDGEKEADMFMKMQINL
ncbi:uncharacterized protein LOC114843738 isoform X1 [Betta splendens]|uniref:Uncharacterized protein LOC114843738 isoform X1 n=1 Tax=Betta splendens TaxID=158456 RepID=A0A9W2Y5K9_BETSP|nr:uncharacterized protein LOC114843738 isoform X1 [Betta splendens]XP_055369309.1 uncharacterized protein LOC114843738 isoform X1 [Betta splendens]